MLKKIDSKIIESPKFFEFLNREFEKTATQATIEELAGFAFGNLEEAIKAYKEIKNEAI